MAQNPDEKSTDSAEAPQENRLQKCTANTGITIRMDIVDKIENSQVKQQLTTATTKVIDASNKMHELTANQASLVIKLDKNDSKRNLMQNNVRNQRRWNKTLLNVTNGVIAVQSMTASCIPLNPQSDEYKSQQFENANNLLQQSLTNIACDAVEQQIDNSQTLNEELCQCKSIMNDEECSQLVLENKKLEQEVIGAISTNRRGIRSLTVENGSKSDESSKNISSNEVKPRVNSVNNVKSVKTSVNSVSQPRRRKTRLSKQDRNTVVEKAGKLASNYKKIGNKIKKNKDRWDVPEHTQKRVEQASSGWGYVGLLVGAVVVIGAVCFVGAGGMAVLAV